MPIQSPYRRARHPVTPVLGRVIVVQHDGPPDNPRRAHQRQVGVGEETAGGRNIDSAAGHGQVGVFVLEVADFAAGRLLAVPTVLVHTEKERKNIRFMVNLIKFIELSILEQYSRLNKIGNVHRSEAKQSE